MQIVPDTSRGKAGHFPLSDKIEKLLMPIVSYSAFLVRCKLYVTTTLRTLDLDSSVAEDFILLGYDNRIRISASHTY